LNQQVLYKASKRQNIYAGQNILAEGKYRAGIAGASHWLNLFKLRLYAPLAGYKLLSFSSFLFSASSLHFITFFSMDISNTPRTTRSLYNVFEWRTQGNSLLSLSCPSLFYLD
jgi:hypothetical protein